MATLSKQARLLVIRVFVGACLGIVLFRLTSLLGYSTAYAIVHEHVGARRLLFSHTFPINGLCLYGLCRPHLRP